ncbi:prolyl-tRNA synthetase [Acetitomaculum ruminis DSM 5522]|uniref:Proline--tRNA ligase n=1 Tax=Acetitomaculum ruminis DSM 5522 TaxID=1120918 RepID=A0A1I0X911_9FIRM|nr:proline--tRNA ligase [Acetitomaculum ruminis]SFA96830.1 prolyl-tRNA synthetase [Acetitomaculum ruminis DSM 5522]
MKLSKLVGVRFKEKPADCVIDSHAFCVRGGYIKQVSNGIFSLYTPMKRITQKIENIIREEMDAVDSQEVMFPVVLPGALWEESGRYTSVGDELLRFKDRNDTAMVLGMTHEEAAVHLARDYGRTYANYPFSIYQIQTKYRDEARPRAGLIRVREFTMKDAYSFHTSQEDLEEYYDRMANAYFRIFQRAGIDNIISVKSDSGMIGGSVSHEYMLLADAGEDSIVICEDCGYSANMEAADTTVDNSGCSEKGELTKVYTPDCKTIEDVCKLLETKVEESCKAVIYQINTTDEYVVVFIRGDYEVNETKLTNLLNEKVHPAEVSYDSGLVAGFCGPYKQNAKCKIIYDKSLEGIENLCCGANEKDYHYVGLNIKRDIGDVEYVDVSKIRQGGICPNCGKKTIKISRGIEAGNIFQLGTKYTESMEMTYTAEDGSSKTPIMGCYGIGIGRLAACVCEAYHDDKGPIWPITIAPWQVHICCMRIDDEECKNMSEYIYNELTKMGIEVIYDDRKVRAGAMFADADLLGVPVRVTVGPKALANGEIELSTRDKTIKINVKKEEIIEKTKELVDSLFNKINEKVQDRK